LKICDKEMEIMMNSKNSIEKIIFREKIISNLRFFFFIIFNPGINFILIFFKSVGSTPTELVRENYENITEIRPGNYVFFDGTSISKNLIFKKDVTLSL
jgi:hypothetical protein